MILDHDALDAAARAVGSTDIATVVITAYLSYLEGPPVFAAASSQPQLPGVHWQNYERRR